MSVSVAIAESEIAPLSILSLDLESPLDSKDLFCCKPLLGSELPLRTSSTWALMSEATLDPDGALPPTQHHLWVLLFFTSTTQLPAGSQRLGEAIPAVLRLATVYSAVPPLIPPPPGGRRHGQQPIIWGWEMGRPGQLRPGGPQRKGVVQGFGESKPSSQLPW